MQESSERNPATLVNRENGRLGEFELWPYLRFDEKSESRRLLALCPGGANSGEMTLAALPAQKPSDVMHRRTKTAFTRFLKTQVFVAGLSVILVALLTLALSAAAMFVNVEHVTTIYIIPVMFAAIRGGIVAAVAAALASIGASAFFFYPPIYDFRVYSSVHIVDLILFLIVAVVTGHLAASVRLAKMREQADLLREAMIGSLSHDLRSPLSAIVGSASVLAQAPEITGQPRLASLVSGLQQESERLNGSIQNLLDATRISNEGIRPHPEWVDPSDIVNAAVKRKSRVLARHCVTVTVPDHLPLLHIDPVLIENALGHLIENAAEYSEPSSSIEITVEKIGDKIRFAVQDQGIGISAHERTRMWERFYRGSRHAAVAGSGLGLWITRALVVASGGDVDAHSEGVGRGATFWLNLPTISDPEKDGRETADD
jgi:two-component system sensor histidine kinase KdpD